jgi:hypothetical protein
MKGAQMNGAAAHRQHHRLKGGIRWLLIPNRKLPPPVNPALMKHAEERAENAQNRPREQRGCFIAAVWLRPPRGGQTGSHPALIGIHS